MKRNFWCIALLMIGILQVQAQRYSDDELTHKYEFGTNITQIINRFVVSTPVENPDASFTLKIKRANDKFLRFGGDLNLTINTTGSLELISNSAMFRVGLEKRMDIEPWIDFYWGADVLGSYGIVSSSNNIDFGDITLTNTTYLGAVRGFAGCHIKIGRRVALEFENNFQLSYQIDNEKLDSELNPMLLIDETDTSAKFQMLLPRSIYFIVKLGS